jgi:ABC-type bacteriocin/lantibiotic exporter with double-glycine peptidase domain
LNRAPRLRPPGAATPPLPALLILLLALAPAAGCQLRAAKGAAPPALAVNEGWSVAHGVSFIPQRSLADCGAAALSMVLARWLPGSGGQGNVDEEQVRQWLGPINDRHGVEAGRLRDVARARGLAAFVIEGSPEDLARELGAGRPVIAGVVNVAGGTAYPHYEVVVGFNRARDRVLTADPAFGWRQQSLSEFDRRWRLSRHLALVVLPAPPPAMHAGQ